MVRQNEERTAVVGQTERVATLRALLDALGEALEPLSGDLDGEVSDVVLIGPGDPVPEDPCALLVCLDPEQALTGGVCAAAAVVKLAGQDRARWVAGPLPVLVADEALPWHHLLHLLTIAATSSAADSGDLFALANAIAAMVGGAVAIEDPKRRVLSYSSLAGQPIDAARQQGILGRQVPELSRNDELYRQMQRAAGVIRVPAEGEVLPRLAVAVRSGAELLGSIWVVEGSPLSAEAADALLGASRSAALHLLRARAGSELRRRARGELLRALLDGRSAPEVVGPRLGLAVTGPVTVMGFGLPGDVASDDGRTEAVADLVQLRCAAVDARSAVVAQLGTVYAVLPVGGLRRDRLTALGTAILARAKAAFQIELSGAVGATVGALAELGRSRADVDAVLRVVEPGTIAPVEDVLPQVVLLDLTGHLARQPQLRLPAVEQMCTHDREQGTHYAESVLAYLNANADVPVAAADVRIHPNTFRYRLRRVKELFDLDLEDPDVRLVVWLQLRTTR